MEALILADSNDCSNNFDRIYNKLPPLTFTYDHSRLKNLDPV